MSQAPAACTAVRLVRTYASAKSSLRTDLADEVFDLESPGEPGVWDGIRLEWLTASGTAATRAVPKDDNLLSLVHTAARQFGCLAIAGHEPHTTGTAVTDDEIWYGQNPIPAKLTTVSNSPNGETTVEVVVEATPSRWVWMFAPMILLSFAWVPFLFIGGLKEMGRQFWRMAVTGSTQRLDATLNSSQVTIRHQDTSEPDRAETIDRQGLMAFSHGTSDTGNPQLLAIYPDHTISLPSLYGRKNHLERDAQTEFVAQLNMVLGSY